MKLKIAIHFRQVASLMCISLSSLQLFSQSNTLPTTGNVGIGTTQPDQKLTVRGSARIDSSLVVRDSMIVDRGAHIRSDLQVDGNLKLAGDLLLHAFRDSSLVSDEVLLLDSLGKVKRGGDLKSLVYAEAAEQIHCLSDMNGGTIYSAPYWQAHGMPNPSMYLINTACSPDPRLGVGVKPTAKMHVQLNLNSTLHPLLVEKRLSNNPNSPQPTTKLMQLDHTGLLYAREIKVNLDQWPDYVFDENYQLMPLEDLKHFIQINNHLPNVPSACEMEEEGMNVAKSNVMLMEKVEELTLYLLQINEQVKSQEQLLDEQQTLIKQQQESIRLQQELIQKLEQQLKP